MAADSSADVADDDSMPSQQMPVSGADVEADVEADVAADVSF